MRLATLKSLASRPVATGIMPTIAGGSTIGRTRAMPRDDGLETGLPARISSMAISPARWNSSRRAQASARRSSPAGIGYWVGNAGRTAGDSGRADKMVMG